MLKRFMDATGDTFPLIMTMIYGLLAAAWGLYYTRDLRKLEQPLRPKGARRPKLVHKPT